MSRWGRVVLAVVTAGMGLIPIALASSSSVAVGHPPIIRLREGTSSNWSGYAAYGAAGRFSSVAATWTQPTVSCTAQNGYSSYWVGLDGYNTSTVEQLGTEGDCINGSPQYYAWYEMYPKRSAFISSLTVTPGHTYSASVVAGVGGSFVLQLTDSTIGMSYTTPQRLNHAAVASAEAVVEAPSNGKVLPLANFGTASFSGVKVNGQPIGSFAPNLDPITMLNPAGTKATPSKLDSTGEQFSDTWSSS